MLTTPLDRIIFIDIETVPQLEFEALTERKHNLFIEKHKLNEGNDTEEFYREKASFLPEFGKIACISVGRFIEENEGSLHIKTASFTGENDKDILTKFISALPKVRDYKPTNSPEVYLCAHYGKVFDFPFIAKRILLNQLPLPAFFDFGESKPWEIKHLIDTIEAWRFGRSDCNASLDLLADSFGVDSPKSGMTGKDVAEVFYKEKNLKKIAEYCEGDVMALATVYMRMKGDYREIIKSK